MSDPERNEPEPLWTVEDVAEFLGLHPKTVRRKAGAGEIPCMKLAGAFRFRRGEIEAWVEDRRVEVA
jgi:excisionase family DNA binding protein